MNKEENNMVIKLIGWYVVVMTTFLSIYTTTKNRSVGANIIGFILFFLPTFIFVFVTLFGGR